MTCIKIHIITKKLIAREAPPALTLLDQCAHNARFCETFTKPLTPREVRDRERVDLLILMPDRIWLLFLPSTN